VSGKWDDPDVPKWNWTCHGVEDLGDVDAVCEMCEVKEIRYLHFMSHPDWPDELACGCICAGHMEQDVDRAFAREADFKRGQGWLRRTWRWSRAGHEYVNAMGYNVVVYPSGDTWGARVRHRASGWQRISERPYETSDKAKLAALAVLVRHANQL
jgi:hypothetical protein